MMNHQRSILSKPIVLCIIGFLGFIALFSVLRFPLSSSNPTYLSLADAKISIIHIVMFEFKEETKPEEITDVCNRMLALKNECLHPITHKPYVKMAIGGKQNSPEGLADGITHAFVEEFENEEDRKYYLEKDPAHLAFVKSIGAVVKKAQVVDFTPGAF